MAWDIIIVVTTPGGRRQNLAALELDFIKVTGKTAAVRVHTLLGDEALRWSEPFNALSRCHAAMLEAYRSQRWAEALDKLAGCRALAEGHNLGGVYDLYDERIRAYAANPPAPGWDGVFTATSK